MSPRPPSHKRKPAGNRGKPPASEITIYGRRPVLEAIKRGIVESLDILAASHGETIRQITELAESKSIPVKHLKTWPDTDEHSQGVRARIRRVEPRHDLEEFLDNLPEQPSPLLLMLDGIEDPRNFGAILRSAYCAAVSAVIIRSRRQAPLTDVVFKSSAGAAALIPVFEVKNLDQTLTRLNKRDYWTAAAGLAPGAIPFYEFDWNRPTVLIVGAEGKGVSALLRKRADDSVAIPLYQDLDSLNVSVATAILLFDAARKRRITPVSF